MVRATSPQTARKPNFVLDDHSSRRRITAPLQQPTRRFWRLAEAGKPRQISPPGRIGPMRIVRLERSGTFPAYLVLLRVGFTLPSNLRRTRCALTAPFHPYLQAAYPSHLHTQKPDSRRRFLLCCTCRPDGFNHPSRTLSGTLPCGVRTFLPRQTFRSQSKIKISR